MMKIPVYRSQAISREIAPGSPLRGTVRKDPRAMAQFEIDKAAPTAALFDNAAKFATVRWQAAQEAQFNEAALAVEEGMREAERTLSKTKDIYNVLDGKNMWQSSMDEIRDKVIAPIGNKDLQRKLSFNFEQNEIASRFRLRGVVDKKILAAEQAALAARMEAKKRNLSMPGTTIDTYNSEMGIIVNDQARGIKGGRYSVEGVSQANRALRKDIAESYLANQFNYDPNVAMKLFNMMGLQDEVMAGKMTEAEAMAKAGVTDEYALHVLYNLDREVAVDVIQKNLAASLKFFDAQNKLENDQQSQQNDLNIKAYNLLTSLDDGEAVTQDKMKQVMGDQAYNALPEDVKRLPTISGSTAKDILKTNLENQFALTPDQQKKVDAAMTMTASIFAEQSSLTEKFYSELYGKAEAGVLTVDELNDSKFQITAQNYRELRQKIDNEASEALKQGALILKRSFKYNELQAIGSDDRLAQASKTAFELADAALQEQFAIRVAQQDPMTRPEIINFAREKVAEFGEIYREELRVEYENYAVDTVQRKLPGLTIDLANPLQSMDDYFAGLDANTQNLRLKNYTLYKRLIKSKYGNQGLGF